MEEKTLTIEAILRAKEAAKEAGLEPYEWPPAASQKIDPTRAELVSHLRRRFPMLDFED